LLQCPAGNAAIARALAEGSGGRRAVVAGVLSGRGVPLRAGLLAEMEARLGASFSDGRPAAAASATALRPTPSRARPAGSSC
jgi:hypothetical protein